MSLSRQSVLVSSLLGCLLLQGCHSVKSTLGLERDPPDEFAVVPATLPLDMPPTFYELPTPRLGQRRPQDVAAAQAEQEKIFGSKPRKTRMASPGEKALLDSVGGHRRQDDIRPTLDTEADEEARKKKNVVLETLGVKKPMGDIIDPHEETKKLREQDIPHPPVKIKRDEHPIEQESLPELSGVQETSSSHKDRQGVVSPTLSVN